MPLGLKRYQQTGDLHFITFSCYQRLPFLAGSHANHVFEEMLETLRKRHGFFIAAYVLMPEHVHLAGGPLTIIGWRVAHSHIRVPHS